MTKHLLYLLKKKFDRYIHDPFFALIILPIFLILKIIPYRLSSLSCGYILKKIGPITKYHIRVQENLKVAFPKKSITEIQLLAEKFWYNFGQIIGELPHIDELINQNKLQTIGLEKIKTGPAILIGAHLGNWEFLLRVAELAGRRAGFVYRPINNWILNKIQIRRNASINAEFFKKGRLAAIGMANKLKKREVIGLTNDQLLREGIMVPFFGKKTPTPQAAAVMAVKWNIPIYMVRVERIDKIKFRMTIEDELIYSNSKVNEKTKVFEITSLISKRIEEWIIERPEQWLWSHRRWGK